MINGVLVINKPINLTSRDVVNEVSKILKTKKIGHTGTLDPLATGVLVLTIGKATKISELITSQKKEYIAEVRFGLKTDTYDITGNILKEENYVINKERINKVVNSFKGTYNQEVPIYSAVKVNGKKLYEYARANEFVELPSKLVTIYEIEILKFTDTGFVFKCLVSKGTYIRSLINDICNKLKTIGVMSNLTRTMQGELKLENAYTLENIKNLNYNIISIKDVLKDIYTVKVDEKLKYKITNGQIIDNIYNRDFVLFEDEELIAIYKTYEKDIKKLKPYKMF